MKFEYMISRLYMQVLIAIIPYSSNHLTCIFFNKIYTLYFLDNTNISVIYIYDIIPILNFFN